MATWVLIGAMEANGSTMRPRWHASSGCDGGQVCSRGENPMPKALIEGENEVSLGAKSTERELPQSLWIGLWSQKFRS